MDSSSAPTDASMDAEIQRVREEITTLTRQKSALTSALLSQPTFTSRLHSTISTTNSTQKAYLDALIRAQKHQNLTEAQRLVTGVSNIDPSDPSQKAALPVKFQDLVDRKDVLGIRFERFSQASRTFVEPGYVILEVLGKVDEPILERDVERLVGCTWMLLEHDLPPYVPVEEMAEKYLGDQSEDEGEMSSSEHGLRAFARCVQKELMAGLRRHDVIARLRANLPEGWYGVHAGSSDAKEVKIVWRDGRVGRVLLDGHGNITNAVVTEMGGNRESSTEQELLAKEHLLAYVEDLDDTWYGWAK